MDEKVINSVMSGAEYQEAKLVEAMTAWARTKKRIAALEKEIQGLLEALDFEEYAVATPHGTAKARFSGRGSFDWLAIAEAVAPDPETLDAIRREYASYAVDWEAVAREVAPNDEVLAAAIAANTKEASVDWKKVAVALAGRTGKSGKPLKAVQKQHYTPPKTKRFKIELKPLGRGKKKTR